MGTVPRAGGACILWLLSVFFAVPVHSAEPKVPNTASDPQEVLRTLRTGISKAQKEQDDAVLLLQLRSCITHAQSFAGANAGTPNPFHDLLASYLTVENKPLIRIIAVKAITTPLSGDVIYEPGVLLLINSSLGADAPAVRQAVRNGLVGVLAIQSGKFVPVLENRILEEHLPAVIEDAAFLLWTVDQKRTIEVLLNGLKLREDAGNNVAVFHCILAEFLLHREQTAEDWTAYWKSNQKDILALTETHTERRHIEAELLALWTEACTHLFMTAGSDAGASACWRFLKSGLEAKRSVLREAACGKLRIFVQKISEKSAVPDPAAFFSEQIGLLLKLVNAGDRHQYEPLRVRIAALNALVAYGKYAASNTVFLKYLARVLASSEYESMFVLLVLRSVGDLQITALRNPLCDFIYRVGKREGPDRPVLLSRAIQALGRIGFDTRSSNGSNPNTMMRYLLVLVAGINNESEENEKELKRQTIKAFGKLAGFCTTEVQTQARTFLKNCIAAKGDGDSSLVFFAVNSLGETGVAQTITDLSVILKQRVDYQLNHVLAAVDAIWSIASAKGDEAFARAVEVFASTLESEDQKLDNAVKQKVLFLCKSSVSRYAALAGQLIAQKKHRSAVELLPGEEVSTLKQKAFADGKKEDLLHFWRIESALLDSYEALDEYARFLAQVEAMKKYLDNSQNGVLPAAEKEKWRATVAERVEIIQLKQQLASALEKKLSPPELLARFKLCITKRPSLTEWTVAMVKKAPGAEGLIPLIKKDVEIPESVKALLE